MFGQINGLPVHALVLHVAVVLTPLAGLAGLAFLVPRWRRALRWPLVALAAAAAVSLFVSRQSGQVLRTALGSQLVGTVSGELVARHAQLATRLLIATALLLVLAVAAVVAHSRARGGRVNLVLTPVLAVVSVGVIVLTYQTGELGAKAAWNPAGTVDYSGG